MPSNSLAKWSGERTNALDEIESAHSVIGGTARGRRYATQQINYSYVALLSSHFQGFCRDLHTECTERIVAAVPVKLQAFVRAEFFLNRALDKGNPHPGGVGSDFERLGIQFWPHVKQLNARNDRRSQLLQELIDWRNAIAHQDFRPVGGNPTLHLKRVRAWRRALGALAVDFDRTMHDYLFGLLGAAPW